jgi:hypothetical protein
LLEGSFKLIYKDKPDKEARVRSNDPLMVSSTAPSSSCTIPASTKRGRAATLR